MIHTHTHTHTHEYYAAIKKNEILLFTITEMNLNGMLSEKSQRQTLYDITYMWSQKNETSEYNKKRNTLIDIKRTN